MNACEGLQKNFIRVKPELVERRIVSYDHRYAGTVDAIAMIGGKVGVLDIKTSQAVYRDYNLQTSRICGGIAERIWNLETRWILRIDQIQKCTLCGATRRTKGGREKVKADWRIPCRAHASMSGPTETAKSSSSNSPIWQNDFQAFLGAKNFGSGKMKVAEESWIFIVIAVAVAKKAVGAEIQDLVHRL